jgi:PTH1 family peptidyl-tRNA hydrolase
MKLIVGLGNPGQPYHYTRHNIGFRLVDLMAEDRNVSFKKYPPARSLYAQGQFKGRPFILAKPLTFMNESGLAVRILTEKFSVPLAELLLVYDDIDLPLGAMRVRAKGGPGTHRGMQSCVEVLDSSNFPRLRLGIRGERGERDLSSYVLEDFTGEEEEILKGVLAEAKKKVFSFLLA